MELHDAKQLLYHYTDAAGLVGILESHSLWATHTGYLNDPSELGYFNQVLDDAINELSEELDRSIAGRVMSGVRTPFVERSLFHSYVASLSADDASASQWLAYGDHGMGFAIGFNKAVLGLSASLEGWRLMDVQYSSEDHRSAMLGAVRGVLEQAEDLGADPDVAAVGALASYFMGHRMNYGSLMKHPAYRYEAESRLVSLEPGDALPGDTRFRTRGPIIVPFRVFDFLVDDESIPVTGEDANPIKEIVIGYSAVSNTESLRILLHRMGLDNVSVRVSETPVRP